MPIFEDNFTGTDGTQLQSHTPDIGTSWTRLWGSISTIDWVINSNRANPEQDTNDGSMYTCDATYPSADYDITLTVVTFRNAIECPIYLLVRVQDQENMYAVYLSKATNACRLYKKVSGTWTALGSAFDEPADGSVCKLEIVGTTLTFYDDGVSLQSVTVSDISAAGKAGIAAGGGAELVSTTDDSNSQNVIDALTVNNLGGGGGVIVPVLYQQRLEQGLS